MNLTREENEILEGKHGDAAQKCMDILVGLAECYDAQRMIRVNSAHLLHNPVTAGEGGILFLRHLADRGGKFVIHTDTNPWCLDPESWEIFGITDNLPQEYMAFRRTMANMGAFLSDTCTPYLIGHVPRMEEHVAWSESSAIIFANSVLGARTNREGGPSAIAAAITGRVPEYGYHLSRNRFGNLKISVTAKLKHQHDYGTLGYFTGKMAQDQIPVFIGVPPSVSADSLKLLGAAAASSGSVALYHIVGITPEAPTEEAAFGRKKVKDWQTCEFGEKELRTTEESLCKATDREVDLVVFGCPHASIVELQEIARLLSGKRLKSGVELWVTTSRMAKAYAEVMGYISIIEASGAKVLSGTCPHTVSLQLSGEPVKAWYPRTVATNSAKIANYATSMFATEGRVTLPYYGSVDKCIEAATTGIWR